MNTYYLTSTQEDIVKAIKTGVYKSPENGFMLTKKKEDAVTYAEVKNQSYILQLNDIIVERRIVEKIVNNKITLYAYMDDIILDKSEYIIYLLEAISKKYIIQKSDNVTWIPSSFNPPALDAHDSKSYLLTVKEGEETYVTVGKWVCEKLRDEEVLRWKIRGKLVPKTCKLLAWADMPDIYHIK